MGNETTPITVQGEQTAVVVSPAPGSAEEEEMNNEERQTDLDESLESLDNSLIEAAYDLGAGGFSILRSIVIPHAAPGITAGCIVVFMLTLGNYLTPTLLGGKNSQWFTEQIYTQFITRFNWEQGAAFGFLLLALSTALVILGLRISGQSFGDVMRQT